MTTDRGPSSETERLVSVNMRGEKIASTSHSPLKPVLEPPH